MRSKAVSLWEPGAAKSLLGISTKAFPQGSFPSPILFTCGTEGQTGWAANGRVAAEVIKAGWLGWSLLL